MPQFQTLPRILLVESFSGSSFLENQTCFQLNFHVEVTIWTMTSIAIIGAGLSGLTCARTLQKLEKDVQISIFEKSRGPSGRMATRRLGEHQEFVFDHGAQYFTARDLRFQKAVTEWQDLGVAQEWKGRIRIIDNSKITETDNKDIKRFVGTPGKYHKIICRNECDWKRTGKELEHKV